MKKRLYVLIDLERSFAAEGIIFWKANKRGYTPNLVHAGTYSQVEAIKACINDIKETTVMLPINSYMKEHMEAGKAKIKLYED